MQRRLGMIEVHHLENSRSQRVLWLLELLELPYTVVRYERDPKTGLAPPALLAVHPLGKSPVIVDGDTVVAESGAIVEYLVDKADGMLRPQAATSALQSYRYWLHFAEGTAMPLWVMTLVFHKIENAPLPFYLKPIVKPIARGISRQVRRSFIEPNQTRQFELIEATLTKSLWFCGDTLTAADVMMSMPLEAACAFSSNIDKYPHIQKFVQTIHAMPSYQKALAVGRPYHLETS